MFAYLAFPLVMMLSQSSLAFCMLLHKRACEAALRTLSTGQDSLFHHHNPPAIPTASFPPPQNTKAYACKPRRQKRTPNVLPPLSDTSRAHPLH